MSFSTTILNHSEPFWTILNHSEPFWTILNRVVTTSVLTGAVVFTPILTVIAQGETLNRAGATFPAPLYELYASEVKQKYPDLKVNY